ncbi:putative protein of unknown function (DUF4496) [Trypanosoma vivax]|uniref:CCDC81 HU domain-containing protein n=1 Tax=Trypanosoma vivax (strain Y486) TaxID=1055687 RepID=G0U754_TRYVY|nr:putative protein of unknown function (DUF4496) [Trypanosoma vivax]CCC51711.1 conserved hypothetical protein [Trypanosoma vivax Y486]
MFSRAVLCTRGAITTDFVMVECAASQESGGKEVFLLSELERVWDAVSFTLRHHLVQGRNVRVANFGSFWLETRTVVSDGAETFAARRIHFGIDGKFALRYNIDSIKVPQEPTRLAYVKVSMSDIVALAKVPASTAATALREFFSFIGEGLFRKHLFKIDFHGVASLFIRRDKVTLEVAEGLRREIFSIDSRRWPLAVREAAEAVVMNVARRPASSSTASRPCTSSTSRTSTVSKPIEPRPAFITAAPRDRLFAEIEKEPPRRLVMRHAPCSDCQAQGPHGNMSEHYVKESIFDTLGPDELQGVEPEIEIIEEVREELPRLRAYEEEAARPVSTGTRHSYHEHSSVRDLLYGRVSAEPVPLVFGRKRFVNRETDEVARLLSNV